MIISEDSDKFKDNISIYGWGDSTNKEFKIYDGVGKHEDMLNLINISRNSEILNCILGEI